jgi:transcriptional regulator with GAF, ATPase, and Fis domain
MATDPRDPRPLTEPGTNVAAFLDFDEMLRRVVSYVSESSGTEGSSILLHDAGSGELVVAVASGPRADDMRGRRFPDTSGVAGAVLRSGQPRIVADADRQTASALADVDRTAADDIHGLMAAPLRVGNRAVGVVETANRIGGAAFVDGDLDRFVSACTLIAVAVESASLYRRLDKQAEILQRSREDHARPFIAKSSAMLHAVAAAERAAAGRSTVLLLGETGTGKEQMARRIHEMSPRAGGSFVAFSCAALPEGLLESELFGHEKGAFTGADRRRIGRFELADGGTLFLDEIGDLPAGAQVKLLRVLQEREISRLGGNQTIRVDVRLIAATHRDLPEEVRAGRFREDLFFRLHVVPIHLPPLRERPDDIEALAELFLGRLARELGRPVRTVTPAGLARLSAHRWPGNVRELENLIERLLVLGSDEPIDAEELSNLLPSNPPPSPVPNAADVTAVPGASSLWDQERSLLMQALERTAHNQTRAAQLLKITREQLRTRMKRYGLLPSKPGQV